MHREVVHDHEVAGLECQAEHFPDVGEEGRCVGLRPAFIKEDELPRL